MGEGKDENAFRYFISKLVSEPHSVIFRKLIWSSIGRRTSRSSWMEF